MGRSIKGLLGLRFGKLVVTELMEKRRRKYVVWKCKCDCGNEYSVISSSLVQGRVKSCGCLGKLPLGEANFNAIYYRYKSNAKRYNRKFTLTKDNLKELTQQRCYYCGIEPKQKIENEKSNGAYIYNGIDRVDNSKGYTVENCVTCCGACNISKGFKTQDEFLDRVKRIYEYRINKENLI